jgi:hypothetical protein
LHDSAPAAEETRSPLIASDYLQGFKEYLVAQRKRNIQQDSTLCKALWSFLASKDEVTHRTQISAVS